MLSISQIIAELDLNTEDGSAEDDAKEFLQLCAACRAAGRAGAALDSEIREDVRHFCAISYASTGKAKRLCLDAWSEGASQEIGAAP